MTLVVTSKEPDGAGFLRNMGNLVQELAAQGQVSILCYGDAVYNLVTGSRQYAEFEKLSGTVYAVQADVEARGIGGKLASEVHRVDYSEVVDLIFAAERLVSCA